MIVACTKYISKVSRVSFQNAFVVFFATIFENSGPSMKEKFFFDFKNVFENFRPCGVTRK